MIIVIVGPTGVGKTEIVRTIGKLFDIPVLVEDMTRYTSAGYKGADLDDILVIHDDMDIKTGNVKLKFEGSAAGHNGIKNIIENLHTDKFKRIKVGISKNNIEQVAYVIGKFSKEEMQKLDDVKEIMHLETASLITNSLLVGYLLSQNKVIDNINLFREIGKDFGYIFQILNDLEPFCSKRNNEHKGSLNTDISRNRKNICVTLLYIYLTSKERRKLENIPSEEKDTLLLKFFQKYQIQEKLFDEINNVYKHMHNNITLMAKKPQLQEWCDHFNVFVDSVITVSTKRLE